MKILITGGAGFIGYHLANELSRNNKVYIIDDFSNSQEDEYLIELCKKKVTLYKFNLYHISDYNKVNNFDKVYYLADNMDINFISENSYEYIYNTINTLNLFLKHINFKKIIYGSTCEVYYNTFKNEDIPENKIFNSFNTYINVKLLCEEMIINFCKEKDLNYNITRFGNIYGERMSELNPIYQLIEKAFKYKTVYNYKNPHLINTFQYIQDCIKDLITVSFGYPDGIFNIGSNEMINNRYIVDLLEIITNQKFKLKEQNIKTYIPDLFSINTDKFNYYYEEEKRTNFALGINKTCKWYRKEGIFDEINFDYENSRPRF